LSTVSRSTRERVLHLIITLCVLSAPLAPGADPALRSSHPPLSPLCEHRSSRSAQTLVGFLSADFAFARSAVPRSPETPHRWRGAGRARPPPAEPTPRAQVPGGRGSGAAAVRSRPSRPALHVLRPCAPACCAGRVPRPLLPRRAPEPQHDAGRRGGIGVQRGLLERSGHGRGKAAGRSGARRPRRAASGIGVRDRRVGSGGRVPCTRKPPVAALCGRCAAFAARMAALGWPRCGSFVPRSVRAPAGAARGFGTAVARRLKRRI